MIRHKKKKKELMSTQFITTYSLQSKALDASRKQLYTGLYCPSQST